MINYGLLHATSEAVLMARRSVFHHLERYRRYGEPLLSTQRPDETHPSPLEDYVAECVVRYDFLYGTDQDYPGIDAVCVCFANAFLTYYCVPLGEE